MTLHDNPDYTCEYDKDGIRIYVPADVATGYTTERYVLSTHQLHYANAGATKEVLQAVCNDVLARCNGTMPTDTIKTDIGTLMNGLLYRMEHPVDAHCAMRMGAILSFMEGEDPEKYSPQWQEKKEALAHEHPDLYTFFLNWGAANIPAYRKLYDILINTDYFPRRRETLETFSITPSEP